MSHFSRALTLSQMAELPGFTLFTYEKGFTYFRDNSLIYDSFLSHKKNVDFFCTCTYPKIIFLFIQVFTQKWNKVRMCLILLCPCFDPWHNQNLQNEK